MSTGEVVKTMLKLPRTFRTNILNYYYVEFLVRLLDFMT